MHPQLNLAKRSLSRLRNPLYRTPLVLILSGFLSAVFGFLFWVVAARYYPAADVGVVAALTSATGLIAILASLGFPTGVLRFLPGTTGRRSALNSIMGISSAASILFAALFIAGTSVWSRDLMFLRSNLYFFVSFILVSWGTTLSVFQAPAFIALRRPGLSLVHATAFMVIRIPLALALAGLGRIGLWASWGLALAFSFALFCVLLRVVEPGYHPTPSLDRRAIKAMAPFSFATLWIEIPAYAATAIIPLMVLQTLGPEATAYYYVGYRVGAVALTVATSTGISLLVEGAYNTGLLDKNVARAIRFTAMLLAPTLLIIFVFGGRILELFGAQYSKGALPVLWMVSLASLPHVIVEFYMTVKKVRLNMRPTILVAWALMALNLTTAWWAMRAFGLSGAGAGWFVSYAVVATAIGALALWRRIHGRNRDLARTNEPG